MRALIVANYAKEHINKFHLETIRRLKEEGWTVDVACNADAEVPYCDHLYNIPCERNPFRIKSIACVHMLKKIIRDNKYDMVHCHTLCGRTLGTFAAYRYKKYGLKLVVTCHGLNYYDGSSFLSKCLIPLDYFTISKADLVFSDNQEDLRYMQEHHFKIHKGIFCPPSVSLNKFTGVEENINMRNSIRDELGIPANRIVLTYVAELNKNKNQILLLEMMRDLIKKYSNAYLVLVGPDHSGGQIEKKIDDYGLRNNVICLGWRNDICRILTASDIYVASSIREGFGLNLLEAMICQLPVIASNNRGHREIVISGSNGYLVKLGQPHEFSNRVQEVVQNDSLRERFVELSNKRVAELFNKPMEDALMDGYHALMEEVKNGRQ